MLTSAEKRQFWIDAFDKYSVNELADGAVHQANVALDGFIQRFGQAPEAVTAPPPEPRPKVGHRDPDPSDIGYEVEVNDGKTIVWLKREYLGFNSLTGRYVCRDGHVEGDVAEWENCRVPTEYDED
jgi:hypothetical protein